MGTAWKSLPVPNCLWRSSYSRSILPQSPGFGGWWQKLTLETDERGKRSGQGKKNHFGYLFKTLLANFRYGIIEEKGFTFSEFSIPKFIIFIQIGEENRSLPWRRRLMKSCPRLISFGFNEQDETERNTGLSSHEIGEKRWKIRTDNRKLVWLDPGAAGPLPNSSNVWKMFTGRDGNWKVNYLLGKGSERCE